MMMSFEGCWVRAMQWVFGVHLDCSRICEFVVRGVYSSGGCREGSLLHGIDPVPTPAQASIAEHILCLVALGSAETRCTQIIIAFLPNLSI